MKTDPYYKSAGMDDYDIAVINANKGNVTIVTPSSTGESFYSLASYGGTINVNMAGADAASHKVNIKGNIIAMRDDKDHNGQPYFSRTAVSIWLWQTVIPNGSVWWTTADLIRQEK